MANLGPGPHSAGAFLSAMRYRDIEYTVVQGIERQLWKWEVPFEAVLLKGHAATKSEAVAEAERAIRPGMWSRAARDVSIAYGSPSQ
jgi:hypothetical protein